MKIKRRDLILGIILLVSSVILLFETNRIPDGPLDRMVGGAASPRGFITIFIYALLFFSVLLLISYFMPAKKKTEEQAVPHKLISKEVFFLMVALLIYIAILRTVGFNVSSFLLLMFFITYLQMHEERVTTKDKKKFNNILLKAFIISISSLIFLNVVFVNLLNVTLPMGFFGF